MFFPGSPSNHHHLSARNLCRSSVHLLHEKVTINMRLFLAEFSFPGDFMLHFYSINLYLNAQTKLTHKFFRSICTSRDMLSTLIGMSIFAHLRGFWKVSNLWFFWINKQRSNCCSWPFLFRFFNTIFKLAYSKAFLNFSIALFYSEWKFSKSWFAIARSLFLWHFFPTARNHGICY